MRETGFALVTSLVSSGAVSTVDGPMDPKFGKQLAEQIAKGMADNWSQVRY